MTPLRVEERQLGTDTLARLAQAGPVIVTRDGVPLFVALQATPEWLEAWAAELDEEVLHRAVPTQNLVRDVLALAREGRPLILLVLDELLLLEPLEHLRDARRSDLEVVGDLPRLRRPVVLFREEVDVLQVHLDILGQLECWGHGFGLPKRFVHP